MANTPIGQLPSNEIINTVSGPLRISAFTGVIDFNNSNLTDVSTIGASAGIVSSSTTYSVGNITQSGFTVTGIGTTFTSNMLNGLLVAANGDSAVILSVDSATQLTVNTSQTISSATTYTIRYAGTTIDNAGNIYSANNINANDLTASSTTNTRYLTLSSPGSQTVNSFSLSAGSGLFFGSKPVVLQTGSVVGGHLSIWGTDGILEDAGSTVTLSSGNLVCTQNVLISGVAVANGLTLTTGGALTSNTFTWSTPNVFPYFGSNPVVTQTGAVTQGNYAIWYGDGVIRDGGVLGSAATRSVSNTSDSVVASVTGTTAMNSLAVFADTSGTLYSGPSSATSVTLNNPLTITSGATGQTGLIIQAPGSGTSTYPALQILNTTTGQTRSAFTMGNTSANVAQFFYDDVNSPTGFNIYFQTLGQQVFNINQSTGNASLYYTATIGTKLGTLSAPTNILTVNATGGTSSGQYPILQIENTQTSTTQNQAALLIGGTTSSHQSAIFHDDINSTGLYLASKTGSIGSMLQFNNTTGAATFNYSATTPKLTLSTTGSTSANSFTWTTGNAFPYFGSNAVCVQSGSITTGHLATWNGNGVLVDGGTIPAGAGLWSSSATNNIYNSTATSIGTLNTSCIGIGVSATAGTSGGVSNATSIGVNSQAINGSATAVGAGSHATGTSSSAFGNGSFATGNYSLALGYACTAAGIYSLAFGNATANGDNSVALGFQATANNKGSYVAVDSNFGTLTVASDTAANQWVGSYQGGYNFYLSAATTPTLAVQIDTSGNLNAKQALVVTGNSSLSTASTSGLATLNSLAVTTTSTLTGNLVANGTANQILGRTTAQAAGYVGEIISSSGAGTGLTAANTNTNIASISLTPGVWDIKGNLYFSAASGMTVMISGFSTTSATLPATGLQTYYLFPSSNKYGAPVPNQTLTITSTTTVYLVAQAAMSGSTANSNYNMYAVRVA